MKIYLKAIILFLSGIIASKTVMATQNTTDAIIVYACIEPIAYVAEQIAGETVHVRTLMGSNRNPHIFEPSPRQMVELSRATIYFKIGLPFEKLVVDKIQKSLAHLTVIDCLNGIELRSIESPNMHRHHGHPNDDVPHDDDNEKDSDHNPDPHVWLSPPNLKIIARNITDALQKHNPPHAQYYETRFAGFSKRIDDLHKKLSDSLKPFRGEAFYVFHPSFGYFADCYGLHQIAIEEAGKNPTPRQLASLIQRARNDNVRIIFVQPQFDKRNAQAVANAIKGSVVPLNALEKNVLENLADIARNIDRSLDD